MSLHLALYFAFVHISLLVPGYVFIKRLNLLRDAPGLQLCLAYVSSLAFFAILATLNYAFDLSPAITRYLSWAVILLSLFIFIKGRLYRSLVNFKFPLFCLLAFNLISLAFISLSFNAQYKIIPDPERLPNRNYSVMDVKVLNVAQTNANDNYIPYRQAQFFINQSDPAKDSFISEWGVTFFQRTPLMGAVVANYFNLLDDKPPVAYSWSMDAQDPSRTFMKFQIIAQILNGLFVLPAFFLLTKLFNRKTALVTSLFLATSQFFVYNAFFSWPKSLVAFFILTAWLLLLARGTVNTILAGVVSGIAYLTHDLASMYIATSILYLLLSKRFRDILFYTIPAIIMAIPWLFTTNIKYQRPSTFIYYPFSIEGIPQPDKVDTIFKKFFQTSPWTIVYIRIESLLFMLSPYQLFSSEGGQELGRRTWALGLYSIVGSLGIGLIVPAYVAIVKYFKRLWPAVIFILVPIFLFALVIGWPLSKISIEGSLHFAQASVVIWSGLAVYWLLSLKSPLLVLAAYLLCAVQFMFFLLYSYKFQLGPWFSDLSDIVCLAVIVSLLTGCGWLVRQVTTGKKNRLTA